MSTRKANLRYRLTVLIALAGLLTTILTSYSPLSLATSEASRPSPPTDKPGAVATSQSKSSFTDGLMPVGANQAALSNSKSSIGLGKLAQSAFTSVNAASFAQNQSLAPASIVAGFGSGLATTTAEAPSIPLPTTLGGRQVRVTVGTFTCFAPLFYVSPTQINYQMPEGTPLATATISVINSSDSTVIAQGYVNVANVAPGIFAVSGTGSPPTAAGGWLRYSGATLVGAGSLETPIEFGSPTDRVYIVLYATGLRNRSSLSAVSVTAGGSSTVVEYAGAQGYYVGQDQINAVLPQSLAGAGQINVVVTVDGVTANTVKITAGT